MEEKLKTTFSINDFESKWIIRQIDEKAIQFIERMGIEICDRPIEIKEEQYQAGKNEWGKYEAGKNAITTSQIRNIFSEVKRIEVIGMQENDWYTDFLLLKPKLAYTTARVTSKQRESKIKVFQAVLLKAYKAVLTEFESDKTEVKFSNDEIKKLENLPSLDYKREKFKRFSQFFEGVLAYHKAYGGKE